MNYVKEIEHADIVHRCFRCGYCKFPSDYVDFNCPAYQSFQWDTFAPGGRMWLTRAWLLGEIKSSARFAQIMFSCATCDNCKEQCVFPRFKDYLPDIFQEVRAQLVEEGVVPPLVRDYFKALSLSRNPYRRPQEERGDWAKGSIKIETFNGQEYLFYIGCVGSFDEVGQRLARSVARVLTGAGVSIGILGPEETCDGNDVKAMGEMGLFQALVEENVRKFEKRGVKKIITLDPHAYNAFKKDYPRQKGFFEVYHYVEILARLLKENKLKLGEWPKKITYHDPCYLGRHNGIYEAPRFILKNIGKSEIVEMRRSGVNAFCCGGGGGNFFTDILGSHEYSPARVRIREARATGAQVVATACPLCTKMLLEAARAEGYEDMEILGLTEIIERATFSREKQ